MSATQIITTQVVAVLLADGWHRVVPGSFSVGTLGPEADLGVPGFRFEEADTASPYRPGLPGRAITTHVGHRRPTGSCAGPRPRGYPPLGGPWSGGSAAWPAGWLTPWWVRWADGFGRREAAGRS